MEFKPNPFLESDLEIAYFAAYLASFDRPARHAFGPVDNLCNDATSKPRLKKEYRPTATGTFRKNQNVDIERDDKDFK